MEKSNSVINQVHDLFIKNNIQRTLMDVLDELPHLDKPHISRALHYLFKQRWVTRELIQSERSNQMVYIYTYHLKKLSDPDIKPIIIAINPIEYYANITK